MLNQIKRVTMEATQKFNEFVKLHKPQLSSSGIPRHFWQALHEKLSSETYDSGNVFQLVRVVHGDDLRPGDTQIFQLQIGSAEGISATDPKHIYLVDHAWTFRVNQAWETLAQNEVLLERMAFITGIDLSGGHLTRKEATSAVFDELWRYANSYSVANAESVEDRMPVWYIMDEVGSAMRHSNDPNFRMVPFYHAAHNSAYSVIFPIKDCKHMDTVTRNFVEEFGPRGDAQERMAMLLPWEHVDFTGMSFQHLVMSPDYFLEGHQKETLPVLVENANLLQSEMDLSKKLKVFTEYKFVLQYLTDERFQFVSDEDDADILWYTSHFKRFEELSTTSPHKFINQFPFEYILTIKDLLCIVCRLKESTGGTIESETLEGIPKWLPITYNLRTELTQFVSYFQTRQARHLNNYWIIKPFNLARGLDMHITSNINCIVRLPTSGPRIAQLYIDRPALFHRAGIGKVKFDLRYVVLLKCVKPLQLYAYKNFFLRFANQPFELDSFHVYEKHFTVMNYKEDAQLEHILCDEFQSQWALQFPDHPWADVESYILKMLREVFECATSEPPPCGIAQNRQSRAVYAADIMLELDDNRREGCIQPKLLEINWMPDCKRACEYYPDFFNDIFKLLFLNIENCEKFIQL